MSLSTPTPGVAFRPASWADLPGWREDNISEAWSAFLASCRALASQAAWAAACSAALPVQNPTPDAARRYFEQHFTPYQVLSADGTDDGLMTGYYEPLLRGSRKPSQRYRYPLYGVPDDLLVIDLAELYPELKGMRLRGRLDGRRVVPYYGRAQIESASSNQISLPDSRQPGQWALPRDALGQHHTTTPQSSAS